MAMVLERLLGKDLGEEGGREGGREEVDKSENHLFHS